MVAVPRKRSATLGWRISDMITGFMPESSANTRRGDVTALIDRMSGGDRAAGSELYILLRDELQRLAEGQFRHGADRGHTLQPTALVHEAWLRLVGAGSDYQGREHFLANAAKAMRSVLVDHARRKLSEKRGGERERVPLDEALPLFEERSTDLVELDDALDRLTEHDRRSGQVVELRFFGGLTIEETASVLETSTATVQRDWQMARLWLLSELDPE